jgi:protein SCO1/2
MRRRLRAQRNVRMDRLGLAVLAGGAASVLLLASLFMWLVGSGTGQRGDEAGIGGPFSLTSAEGAPVTDRSFPGKYLLIYFGYSTCLDVCPATLNNMTAALDRLGEKASLVQPLFITIDPVRDTPSVLQHYIRAFSPRLIGLTGAPGELRRVADEYRVVSVLHQEGNDPRRYALDHSSVVYLMAPDGRFVAPIPATAGEMVMVRAIDRNL